MARRDERRRNNRARIETTRERQRIVDGGQQTQKVKGAFDKSTGKFVAEWSGDFARKTDDGFETLEGGHSASLGEKTSVVPISFKDTSLSSAYGSPSEGNYLEVTIDNPDKKVTETYKTSRMQALDGGRGDSKASQNRKLKTKSDGRNKLRIQMSGDSSSSRLSDTPNSGRKRNKMRIDVQNAGSGAGINAPR